MDKKEIFISYRSTESAHAYFMKDFLETNGFSVWMAPESIPVGSDYAHEIPNALQNCSAVVLILSRKAQRSVWVRREIETAFNMGKTVMPFMIEKCDLNREFNFYLSNVQRYEAYVNKTEVLYNMMVELCRITGKEAPPEPVMPDNIGRQVIEEPMEDSKVDSFLIRLTPYGRKVAKNKRVRTLLHTATIVIASQGFPALGAMISMIKYAPFMPLFILIAFMAAWYISYGVCLRLSKIKSNVFAIFMTAILTLGISGILILGTSFILPALMR